MPSEPIDDLAEGAADGTPTASSGRPTVPPSFDLTKLHRSIASWMRREGKESKFLRQSDEYRDLMRRAYEGLTTGDVADPLVLELEGAYGAIYYEYDTLLHWWLGKEGPAFMVRAYFERWRYDPWGHSLENLEDPYYRWAKDGERGHRALRRAVASLDESGYAKAVAKATKLRRDARFPMRCTIAFAFPDEPQWAADDARDIVAHVEGSGGGFFGWRSIFTAELVASLREPELTTTILKIVGYDAVSFVPELTEALEAEASGPLARLMGQVTGSNRETAAVALSALSTPIAAEALARSAADKDCRAAALAFAMANPRLAAPALAKVIGGAGKAADAARQILLKLAVAATAEVEASLAEASTRGKAPLEQALAILESVDEASASELPICLASPPWAGGKKPHAPPVVSGLIALEVPEAILWEAEQRGSYGRPVPLQRPAYDAKTLAGWGVLPKGIEVRTEKMDRAVAERFAHASSGSRSSQLRYASGLLHAASDAVALALWNDTPTEVLYVGDNDLAYALGRFGLDALPSAFAHIDGNPQALLVIAAHIGSVKLAPRMADAHHRTKKLRVHGEGWMLRFPEHAAVGLIPAALSSKSAKAREAGCGALRFLASSHRDVVLTAADRYGAAARVATEQVLDTDPLDLYPKTLKKLPQWFDPATLPRPTVTGQEDKDDKALPIASLTHLATMLSFSKLDAPYRGLSSVREVCNPESLGEFAWGLFQQWLLAGGVGKDDWALTALGHLGDDHVARRLGPLVRAWPGESAHGRAVKGLDVLAAIGTDIALMHLAGIATKVRFKGLQQKARERVDQIAEDRGLTPEELADRLVPDLDLDPDGSRELSFGIRVFRVGFDEGLVPFVVGEDEKVRKTLPKANKSDDADDAKASAKVWKALKKDARTLAKDQLRRLEHAMCTGRSWDVPTFRMFLVGHPLVIHLLRRLVCGLLEDGELTQTFMVDEDRRFANADDDAFEFPEQGTVLIPHRLLLADELVERWSTRISDYELIQPFAQLGRDTYAHDDADANASAITRFNGVSVATGKVLGLESRGWQRGFAEDAGWVWEMHKPIGEGQEAVLRLGGGLLASDLKESPKEQELTTLVVRNDDEGVFDPRTLSAVIYSELIRDLEGLRTGAEEA